MEPILIKSGIGPTRWDHRDLDHLKTMGHKFGGLANIPPFPAEYNTDAGLWMPDQNEPNMLFNPIVPALPEGCTEYATCDIFMDEDKVLYNPAWLESNFHANANGGSDLRTIIGGALKVGMKTKDGELIQNNHNLKYFAVKPDIQIGGYLDWFDACRASMTLGLQEHRAVSVGTKWFPEFMQPTNGIVPMPNWGSNAFSWHNWKVGGWTTVLGVPYLLGKPWIGNLYGRGGFALFPREVFNTLMSITGTAAFIVDRLGFNQAPAVINSTVDQWLTSLFYQLLHIIL